MPVQILSLGLVSSGQPTHWLHLRILQLSPSLHHFFQKKLSNAGRNNYLTLLHRRSRVVDHVLIISPASKFCLASLRRKGKYGPFSCRLVILAYYWSTQVATRNNRRRRRPSITLHPRDENNYCGFSADLRVPECDRCRSSWLRFPLRFRRKQESRLSLRDCLS